MLHEEDFMKALQSSDRRVQLEALRDLVAHELSVNRCEKCQAIRIRASDTAALVLRLQKILEELDALPLPGAKISPVEALKQATAVGGDNVVSMMGTKSASRQQGGRRRG